MEPITDQHLRQACERLHLFPLGHVSEGDDPSLGFAPGRPSPGWQYLRTLVDEVQQSIAQGSAAHTTPGALSTSIGVSAQYLAGSYNWKEAMVCAADLGSPTQSETVEHYLTIFAMTTIGEIAIAVLASQGKRVCAEIFAEQLHRK